MSLATPIPAPPRRLGRIALAGLAALWLAGWLATWPTTPAEAPASAPMLVDEGTNAVPLYLAAGVLHRPPAVWPTLKRGQAPTANERAYVAANGRALALFHEARALPAASLGRPDQVALSRYEREADLYNAMKNVVMAANYRFEIALLAGRHAEALEASADCLDAVRKLAGAPGQDLAGLALTEAVAMLHDYHLRPRLAAVLAAPEPALAAYARALDEADRRGNPIENAVLTEGDALFRSSAAAVYDRMGLDTIPDAAERKAAFLDVIGPSRDLRRRWAAHNAALVRARDPRLIRVFDGPPIAEPGAVARAYLGLPFHPAGAIAEVQALDMQLGIRAVLARVLLEQTRFQAMRVRVALTRFERAMKRPAASLAALVPAYLPAVPADPYMPERPLSYDGKTLWSVGADRVDQHGQPAVERDPKNTPGHFGGDEALDYVF